MNPEKHFFKKILEMLRREWLSNIFLAILIYYLIDLGRMMGFQNPPLKVSAVWPATGISLAALLICGNKMSTGIFIGNLVNNCTQLHHSEISFLYTLIISICISAGSTLEAFYASYFMKKYSSPRYFESLKDTLIFLFPVALIACMIPATIAAFVLFHFGGISLDQSENIWIDFWVGDLMGIYIFTPLLVVWSLIPPRVGFKQYWPEALSMGAMFIFLFYFSNVKNFPLTHFYIPLCIWVAYRFRLHGATLCILAVCAATVIPTTMGEGTFVTTILSDNRILILVSFLEIIVGLSLIIASLVNEREAGTELLEKQNIELQQSVDLHREVLKEAAIDVALKDKFAVLNLLNSKIANYVNTPLQNIFKQSNRAITALKSLENILVRSKTQSSEAVSLTKIIHERLDDILKYRNQVSYVASIIAHQPTGNLRDVTKTKIMNINALITLSLNQIIQNIEEKHPTFKYIVQKEIDKSITTLVVSPVNLARVFLTLFDRALLSLLQKKDKKNENFLPMILLKTLDAGNAIEIQIEDNGIGLETKDPERMIESFLELTENQEIINFNLALIHDIIVSVYQGTIQVESKEGEYFKCIITIPKEK